MGQLIDLSGYASGNAVVLHRTTAKSSSKQAHWLCRCNCGASFVSSGENIRKSAAFSCGCQRGANISAAKERHGEASIARKTTEYRVWASARSRTSNLNNPAWKDYGGRGICMDERWHSFEMFLADMGRRPSPKHTLDRINNDGPYSRDNCRWATKKQQARNRRSSTKLEFGGETKTIAEWAEIKGINGQTLTTRLRDGWTLDRALTTPVVRTLQKSKAAA